MRMQINPYLSFNGQCEAAFKFYEQCLGGKGLSFHKYGGSPMASQVPADWHDKVMGVCVASAASRRYTRPGHRMRTGGCIFSIVRT